MVYCKICSKSFNNSNGLSKHIYHSHKIDKEDYYNKYIKESSPYCKSCGKQKKFRNLGVGYLKYCSAKCRSNDIGTVSYWKGKKQPKEMIHKRKQTLMERYGVDNGLLVHHAKCERYKGFTVRSKYEKIFLDYCESRCLSVSVPNRIRYELDERERWYYPDFYLNDYNRIVEVKSSWTYLRHVEMNCAKHTFTLMQGYDIIFIDEENGLLDNWNLLDEYILY